MAITVYFTTESKRENSTKQLAMPISHSCTFKNGCSMLNPTLFLEIETEDFPAYTAFKIEDRYYNITDIRTVRNNLFEVSGEVDVLATYKSNILATTAYVLYDNVPNTELVDNRLPMKTTKSVSASSGACPLQVDGGCYILSLTGSNDTTGVYKVTEGELASLIDDLSNVYNKIFDYESTHPEPQLPTTLTVESLLEYYGDWWHWLWGSIKYPLTQFFGSGNIPENIRECKFIPFNRGTTLGQQPIYLGTFETNTSLSKLNTDTIVDSVTVSIPWQTSDYRRRSPFTDVYLYIPYIGMSQLSSENLAGQSSVTVQYALCVRDGSMTVTVTSGNEILGQYSANVATSVPVGFSNVSLPKVAQSIVVGAASLAAKHKLPGIGLASINFGDSVTPNFSCIGGLDGLSSTAANQNVTCYTVFHDTNVAPNSEIATIGAPTMAPKSLATLTGFVQTNSASVEGAMSAPERNKINRLLDSGIFIE